MKRLIFGALALWVLLATPLTVAAHDKPATASVDVDCEAKVVNLFFRTSADELTYQVSPVDSDTPIAGPTTIEVSDGEADTAIPLPADGDYSLVFDPEDVIDKSFGESQFSVDCPKPTPTPHPSKTPPPTCGSCVTMPPHKTVPPSDTATDPLAMAVGPNPLAFIGLFLISVAVLGMGLEARNRRR